MENLQTLLFKSITKISKESRLVFDKKKPTAKPAPATAKPSAATTDKTTLTPAQQKDKLKVALKGNANVDLKTTDWSSVQGGIIGRVNKFIKKASEHSTKPIGEMTTKLKALETAYKALAKTGFTAAGLQKLNAKLKRLNLQLPAIKTKVDRAKMLLEAAKSLLSKDQIKAELKKRLKNLPGIRSLPANLQVVALQTLLGYSDEIHTAAIKSLGVASKGLELATITLKKANKIEEALRKFPTKATQIMAFLEKISAVKPIIEKINIYTATIQTVLKATKNCYTGTRIDLNGKKCSIETGKMLKNFKKLIGKKTLPKDIVAKIKKHESRIIAAALLDSLGKNQAELLIKLKVAGLIDKNTKSLSVDVFMRILGQLNCKYLDFESSSAKSLALQSSAKLIHSLVSKIPGVKMKIEGGANSTAISTRSIENVRTRILPIAKKIKGLTGKLKAKITSIPQIRKHLSEIMQLANATSAKKFQELMVKAKANPAKWFGGGGVFNTLLALQRAESVSGDMTKPDSLFYKGNCTVLTRAVKTGGDKVKDRYSRVSFVLDIKAKGTTPKSPDLGEHLPQKVKIAITALRKKAVTALKSAAAAKDPKVKVAATNLETALGGFKEVLNPAELAKLKNLAATTVYYSTKIRPAAIKVVKALKKLADAVKKAGVKVPGKPTAKPTEYNPKTPTKGEKTTFNGVEYTMEKGKYKVSDLTVLLSKPEFMIYVGKEIPTKNFMKKYTKVSWLKDKPSEYSYSHSDKKITRILGSGDSIINITYDIGGSIEIKALNSNEDVSGLLKDTTPETLKQALNAGLDISEITATNKIEIAIKKGEYYVALEELAKEKTLNVGLITACLFQMERTADINRITADQLNILKGALPKIIENWPSSPISQSAYNKFKTINGENHLSGKLLGTLLEYDIGGAEIIQDLLSIKANQTNQKLLKKYLYVTDADFYTDVNKKGLNIALIAAYNKNVLQEKAMNFVLKNYAEIEKKKPGKAISILMAHIAPGNKVQTDETFKQAYELLYKTPKLSKKNIPANPETWAKYIISVKLGLFYTEIENDTASDTERLKYYSALLKEHPSIKIDSLGADNNLAKAKKIAKILKKSTDNSIKLIGIKLDEKIKSHDTKYNNIDNLEVRGKARLEIIYGESNYLSKIIAIDELLGDAFEGFSENGLSRNAFVKKLKKLRAKLDYKEENWEKDDIDTSYISEPQQKFVAVWRSANAPSSKDLNYLIANAAVIGQENLIKLAKKDKGPLTKFQQAKIYRAFGIKAETQEVIDKMDEGSEKSLLKAQLAASKAKLDKYKEAFDAIKDETPPAVKLQIIEGYYKQIQVLNKTNPRKAGELEGELDKSNVLKTLANKKLAKAKTDAEKELIIKAKLIRVSIEKGQCEIGVGCDANELVTEAKDWLDTQKKLDTDFVKGLKEAVTKSGGFSKLNGAAKKLYIAIMVKAAKQSKKPKDKAEFLKGIKADDLENTKDKVTLLETRGKYFEAAGEAADGKEKFRLLNLAARQKGVDKVKLANAYAEIGDPEATMRKAKSQAVKIYIANKKYTKAADILKDPDLVHPGVAAKLIKRFPTGQKDKVKTVADGQDFYDIQLDLFRKSTNIKITIEAINAGLTTSDHGIKLDQVMAALKAKRPATAKKVEGDKKTKTKFYKDNYDKYIKDKSNETDLKKTVLTNLDLKEDDVK